MDNTTTKQIIGTPQVVKAPVLTTEKEEKPLEKKGFIVTESGKSYDIFQHVILKGLGAGNNFYGPNIKEITPADLVNIHGEENTNDFIRSAYRRICNSITKGAFEEATNQGVDKDPNAVLEIFKKFFVEMSSQGDTKAELEEKKDELMGDLMKLAPLAQKDPSKLLQFIALSEKCQKVQAAIDAKVRVPKKATEATAVAA